MHLLVRTRRQRARPPASHHPSSPKGIHKGAQRRDALRGPRRASPSIAVTWPSRHRELIRERSVAGLEAARARGRKGGRKFALSEAQVRLAQSAMAHRDTSVSELCRELGIRPVTLYRYVDPQGQLPEQGRKVFGA